MTVMTSKHFTGAYVAISRVLQKQNSENPNQKLDGPLLLSLAQTPQGENVRGYIQKVAQMGLKGWAEEFGQKMNIINHREILAMKKDIIIAHKVHEALTHSAINSQSLGGGKFGIEASKHGVVVDKISNVISEIANYSDRIQQSRLSTALNDGLDKVLNNPSLKNELLSEASKKITAAAHDNVQAVEKKAEVRKSADHGMSL